MIGQPFLQRPKHVELAMKTLFYIYVYRFDCFEHVMMFVWSVILFVGSFIDIIKIMVLLKTYSYLNEILINCPTHSKLLKIGNKNNAASKRTTHSNEQLR